MYSIQRNQKDIIKNYNEIENKITHATIKPFDQEPSTTLNLHGRNSN